MLCFLHVPPWTFWLKYKSHLHFWHKFKSHLHFAFVPSFATTVAKAVRAARKAAAPKAAAPKKAMKVTKAKKK